MGLKTKVLVLKRIRAGDQDLLAKVYGKGGVIDLLVRDGFLNNHRFFGLFEPFNLLEVDLSQRGGIAIPNDIGDVKFLSYLCRDFERFLWFSWISGFILKFVKYYDEKLFNLFISYMLSKSTQNTLRIKFRLDYLELSGLKPKFLEEEKHRRMLKLSDGSTSDKGDVEVSAESLNLIKKVYRAEKPQRIKIGAGALQDLETLLDLFIEHHIR
ncbi:recombination protein O [Hydrogenivirga caldilitoris]|uniref:Recombination protein O n=1 Tax=Hydrogenivirga caldilitoris TaxID=246264 RepID=A0A497XP79_9AQUI|nr:DNA repair protein RecO C-terminal domain-containing protein [Hydrogenivirga caldilitoris]RLJ69919.1 recombination protein O [Hydrogenivirga caldilitoris]